jgi:hypothetical protein
VVLEEVLLVVLERVDARALVLDLVVQPLQDLPPLLSAWQASRSARGMHARARAGGGERGRSSRARARADSDARPQLVVWLFDRGISQSGSPSISGGTCARSHLQRGGARGDAEWIASRIRTLCRDCHISWAASRFSSASLAEEGVPVAHANKWLNWSHLAGRYTETELAFVAGT